MDVQHLYRAALIFIAFSFQLSPPHTKENVDLNLSVKLRSCKCLSIVTEVVFRGKGLRIIIKAGRQQHQHIYNTIKMCIVWLG